MIVRIEAGAPHELPSTIPTLNCYSVHYLPRQGYLRPLISAAYRQLAVVEPHRQITITMVDDDSALLEAPPVAPQFPAPQSARRT